MEYSASPVLNCTQLDTLQRKFVECLLEYNKKKSLYEVHVIWILNFSRGASYSTLESVKTVSSSSTLCKGGRLG